ncbi:MAG: leucine-rich repeat domain-containing protein [Clostridia bacterium]|nr:leucine-rich repeat domain-containing protein [Clostridia bacterium]MBQ8446966.1 leucine-rich repeat domain-containing protein [Clostridia bacterium]
MKGKWLKVLAVLGCLALATGVAACDGKGNGDDGGDSGASSSSLPEISASLEDSSSEVVEESSSQEVSSSVDESSSEEINSEEVEESSEVVEDSSSEDGSVEEEFYTEGLVFALQDDDRYAVTGYTGTATEVVIPSVYNSKALTSIGEGAFAYCDNLTSITFGENSQLTSIADFAFIWCSNLTEIIIPDSVRSIGKRVFHYCYGLTNITVGENNTQYKSIDGNLYTKDGTVLIQYALGKTTTSFTIPDSVMSIGDAAFLECYSLIEIVIPDNVTSIGEGAFV